MEDENKLQQTLFKLHVDAYPLKSKQVCQADEATKMWNEIRNKDNFDINDKHPALLKLQLCKKRNHSKVLVKVKQAHH